MQLHCRISSACAMMAMAPMCQWMGRIFLLTNTIHHCSYLQGHINFHKQKQQPLPILAPAVEQVCSKIQFQDHTSQH